MFDQVFMDMLKNREAVVRAFVGAYEQAEKTEKGLSAVADSVITNPSEENLRKMLNTTMKCVKNMSAIIKMLIMIDLVYVSGNNYSGDVVGVLLKLGREQEAARELYKQKMEGI